MVRKTIFIAVIAVGLAVAGGVAVRHYSQYKNKQVVAAQSAAKAAEAQATATKARQADFLKEFQKVQGECARAAQAWSAVPASVRAKVPAPDCSVTKPIDL
jgi:uncharacterized membrane protein YebE (DUF533 family)